MNNIIGKLAILFAGVIVAGAFMNIYALVVSLMLIPTLISLRLNFGVNPHQVAGVVHWICLAAGVVTAYFVMRPAWNATDKKPQQNPNSTNESE